MTKAILLVDDEGTGWTEELLHNFGYLVLSYTSGNEALRECQRGLHYDLALIDLSLPDINGYEVISSLKKFSPKIPVVSFSGYAYKAVPADAYVTKPIVSQKSQDDFHNTLERLLQRK